MNEIDNITKALLNQTIAIDFSIFFQAIILSAILAYLIKLTYIKTSQSLSNKDNFSDIFIPLAMITCLVITIIKFSLALSLGLVGALSIVRFRAAIKEPEELVYLFFSIGVGLANGANQFLIAIVSTLIIIIILFLKYFISTKKNFTKKEEVNVNIMQVSIHSKKISIQEIIDQVKGHVYSLKLKSANINETQQVYSFILNFKNSHEMNKFFEYSKKISNKKVHIELYTGLNVFE
jgi:hypothetical protein